VLSVIGYSCQCLSLLSGLFIHCFPLLVSISPLKQLKIFFSPIAFLLLFVLFAPVSSIQENILLADRMQSKIFENNRYLIKIY